MAKAPAFQFYVKQYVADKDVQAMEWDARGMYVHLLCMAWQEIPPGTIPNDDAVIRRWLNLSRDTEDDLRTWRRVRPQIMAAWTLRDGRWYQSGMCETWERMVKRSQASTNNVRKRYQHTKEEVGELVDPGITKKISESYISEIYGCYPRKIDKGNAFKAIASALQRLLSGKDGPQGMFHSIDDAVVYLKQRVRLYAASPDGQAGKFTPYPASWFNGKRYTDDESEWAKRANSEPTKAEHKRDTNRQNLIAELDARENARPGGTGGKQRDFTRGNPALVGHVQPGEPTGH